MKRKSGSSHEIRQKIRRLESKLEKKSRRRIISTSSSSEDELPERPINDEITTGTPLPTSDSVLLPDMLVTTQSCPATNDTEPDLDEEILAFLGEHPKNETVLGQPVHKDLAVRWNEILIKGLPKEVKQNLLDEYTIPSNCEMLKAPILNPETKAAISDNLVKRDNILETKQNQIGSAIAALSKAITSIIEKDFAPSKLLKPVSDACRLLCDSHYNETKTRRHFMISTINSDMKQTMSETIRDKYLFGENVVDKLKSAKSIKKSGIELKQKPAPYTQRKPKFNKNNFIKNKNKGQENWRSLQRKSAGKSDAGSRTAQSQRRTETRSGYQRREAEVRSPPPPRPRTQRRQ